MPDPSDGRRRPSRTGTGPATETSSSLRRALAILFALDCDEAVESGGLSLTRIAELVGREKSQVSRALKALWENNLVERDPETLAYRIGWRVFAMAARVGEARLPEAAPLVLGRLVQDVGERCDFSVLQGAEVLTVMSKSPAQTVQATGWTGSLWPAYSTSAGRALLMDLDRQGLELLFAGIEFDRRTPNAPRDIAELERRIETSRAQGYATTDEELEADLVGVAAPVRDIRGHIVACVNVSAPKFRFHDRLHEVGPRVKAAADELSRALHWNEGGAGHPSHEAWNERRARAGR
jgi:IclR family KDG regulon transcriptional repressor